MSDGAATTGDTALSPDRARIDELEREKRGLLVELEGLRVAAQSDEARFALAAGRVARVGGWELDAGTQRVHWTAVTREIHEVPPDYQPELATAIEFYHPDDRPRIEAAVAAALERGTPYDLELRLITAKGRQLWTQAKCTPVLDGRKVVKLFGTFQDITERKHARDAVERALRENQALLAATRVIVDNIDFGNKARAICDELRDLTGATAGYLGLLPTASDHAREDLPVEEWLATGDGAAMPLGGLRAEAYRRGQAVYDNALHERDDADRMPPSHLRIGAVLLAPLVLDGKAQGLIGLANKPGGFGPRDVELAEAFAELTTIALREARHDSALEQSEEQFRRLFEQATDGLLLADESRRFVMANAAIARMLGYEQEELIGLSVADIHPPADLERVVDAFDRQHAGEFDVASDLPVMRKDGTVFYADIGARAIEIGGRQHQLGSFRDVTERQQMQAKLAQADRLSSMGMLAAGVAHEINNPLSYLLYNLEQLTRRVPRLVEADDALRGAERIRDITRGLSTFTRVEQEQLAPVDVQSVLEVVANMAANEIKYRARLIRDYGPIRPALASEGRLNQVFLNLVINAAQAITEGDVENNEIRIRTWMADDLVCVEIADTGTGISPQMVDRLFEPFYTTKEAGVGSGLGLAISKNIVEGYGGRIHVSSHLDEGSSFLVQLPVAPAPSRQQRVSPPEQSGVDAELLGRILIVDDERRVRTTMTKMLRGHEIVTAGGGRDAQRILERDQAFDLIFCDIMMPELPGIELHLWLCERYPTLAERVVFVTGGAFTPRARKYLAGVENPRLDKPFTTLRLRGVAREQMLAMRATARP